MTGQARLSIDDVKMLLVDRLEELVGELVPAAKSTGPHWKAVNPWRGDRRAGSFIVYTRLKGARAGGFVDFASGEKGDVLDLIGFARCGAGMPPSKEARLRALAWAKDWLGIANADRAQLEVKRETAQRALKKSAEDDRAGVRKKRRRAFEIYLHAHDFAGSLGETYLRTRGVDCGAIAWDDRPRYVESLAYWGEPAHWGPALVFAMRHKEKGFAALHTIWLSVDGKGKAPFLSPAKMSIGPMLGSAIRVARAPGEEKRVLALCEGPEDAASVAAACPEMDVWAVAGLSNLAAQRPLARHSGIICCADNDWAKPAAEAGLSRALTALARPGLPVSVARSFVGKDMNDLTKWRAAK
jgi:hypothetical protein